MSKYNIVFVVLVYKNIKILHSFFQHLNEPSSKVIIVNSFYDNDSLLECEAMAKSYNADFISIPNKGFSYGNNIGCKYAKDHYDFNFLITSNSDIEINSLSGLDSFINETAVIAPDAYMPTGKKQNPNIVAYSDLYYYFNLWGRRLQNKYLTLLGCIVSRLQREIFWHLTIRTKKCRYSIFSVHGCFIIFTRKAFDILYPLFSEDMFLYNEELYLAFRCKQNAVPVFFVPSISVFHHEGASTSKGDLFYKKCDNDSFMYVNSWRKRNRI